MFFFPAFNFLSLAQILLKSRRDFCWLWRGIKELTWQIGLSYDYIYDYDYDYYIMTLQ